MPTIRLAGARGRSIPAGWTPASLPSLDNSICELITTSISSNQDFTLPATRGAYVDLPDGIISALGAGGPAQATFEAWINVETNRFWARIFDFGKSNGVENTSGGADMSNYIFLTPQGGPGVTRLGSRANPARDSRKVLLTTAGYCRLVWSTMWPSCGMRWRAPKRFTSTVNGRNSMSAVCRTMRFLFRPAARSWRTGRWPCSRT